MTFAAGFTEYDEIWSAYNGKTFFIAMEQRNHVLMCERPILFCGFFGRLIFKLWIL